MKLTEIFSSKNLSKKDVGSRGEELAVRLLKKQGYKILARNFSVHRVGELDVVAMDGDCLCFVEVRARSRGDFGTPAETVSAAKRARLVRAAEVYMLKNGLENAPARFDVVEVYAGDRPRLEIIKDAFYAD